MLFKLFIIFVFTMAGSSAYAKESSRFELSNKKSVDTTQTTKIEGRVKTTVIKEVVTEEIEETNQKIRRPDYFYGGFSLGLSGTNTSSITNNTTTITTGGLISNFAQPTIAVQFGYNFHIIKQFNIKTEVFAHFAPQPFNISYNGGSLLISNGFQYIGVNVKPTFTLRNVGSAYLIGGFGGSLLSGQQNGNPYDMNYIGALWGLGVSSFLNSGTELFMQFVAMPAISRPVNNGANANISIETYTFSVGINLRA
jgi:hypothetical protein